MNLITEVQGWKPSPHSYTKSMTEARANTELLNPKPNSVTTNCPISSASTCLSPEKANYKVKGGNREFLRNISDPPRSREQQYRSETHRCKAPILQPTEQGNELLVLTILSFLKFKWGWRRHLSKQAKSPVLLNAFWTGHWRAQEVKSHCLPPWKQLFHIQPGSEVSGAITWAPDRLREAGKRPERNSQQTSAHSGQVPKDKLGSSPRRTARGASRGTVAEKWCPGPQGAKVN